MKSVDQELAEIISRLGAGEKRKVLDYARTVSGRPTRGIPGPGLHELAGCLSDEDARQMLEAIRDCERIDPDDWDSSRNPFDEPRDG